MLLLFVIVVVVVIFSLGLGWVCEFMWFPFSLPNAALVFVGFEFFGVVWGWFGLVWVGLGWFGRV